MTSPAPSTLQQSHDVLKGSISQLIVLRDQLSGLDDLKAEQQKAQAELDRLKQNVKGMQIELSEVKREHDKILAQAWEKQKEVERLDAEIKERRQATAQLNEWRDKMLQQLQR